MEHDEKRIVDEFTERLQILEKKTNLLKVLLICLIILCASSSVLIVFFNFLADEQGDNILSNVDTKEIVETAENLTENLDYELASTVIMSSLKSASQSQELYRVFSKLLESVTSNTEDPVFVLQLLDDSKTFVAKISAESHPSEVQNIFRYKEAVDEARRIYLEKILSEIESDHENISLVLRNYGYFFVEDKDLLLKVLSLLKKELETLVQSKSGDIDSAYDIFDIVTGLIDSFKLRHLKEEMKEIDEIEDQINKLVETIETNFAVKQVNDFLDKLEKERMRLRSCTTDICLNSSQILFSEADKLLSSPFLDNVMKEKIYQGIYSFQNEIQSIESQKRQSNLKFYNSWALSILKDYNEKGDILQYATKIGLIDPSFLFQEVRILYDYVLNTIINNIKKTSTVEQFIDTMFKTVKVEP